MIPHTQTPVDRAALSEIVAEVRSDHIVLRHLAENVTERSVFSADDALSLADAMVAHERAEARLFTLPDMSQPPELVKFTAEQSHRRREEFVAGTFERTDARTAARRFVDALLAHLAAEEAWLFRERLPRHEGLAAAAF